MDEVIKESDLIQLDGTIEKLIKQLSDLNDVYGSTIEALKVGAHSVAVSLKAASGATREGRAAIDEASLAADRYKRAQYELSFALSDVGKQVAWLKAQTADVNKATVDQQRQLQAAASSYDRIKEDIKELTKLYKSLTAAEREDAGFGEQVISELQAKNAELKKLDQAIRPVVEQMSRLQKAEKELAYWQSDEGQQLLKVKQQIKEVTSARKEAKTVVDPLVAAQEKLSKAQSAENQQLKELAYQTKQANTYAELQAKVVATQEGSYNRLAAQYELTKFEMKNLNTTTAEGAAKLEEMQQQAREMYAEMRRFQEATGVYSLGVGDYANSWGGLGYSVQQVVRELPAATVSLNTFFLAISNNIPMLIDEINRTKAANASMLKEGKQVVPVSKQIVKALFSWQSALVIVLTALSMYGKELGQWVVKLFKGKNAILEMSKALKNVATEMKDTNANYGENMVTLHRLTDEWKALKDEAEKTKWIKDNKDAFKQLDIAIYDVASAEEYLVDRTDDVRRAFQDRARAAAAYKLTQDKYEELLLAEEKRRQAEATGVTAEDRRKAGLGADPNYSEANAQQAFQQRLQNLKNEEASIQQQIDLYYELGKAATNAADAKVDRYSQEDGKTEREKRLRDLTDYINNMKLRTTEKYESAITELEKNEYEKRRKEANKAYTTGIIELQNMYDKNERILKDEEGKYKDLTDEQLATVMTAQSRISATIANLKKEYDQTLSEISLDEQIGNLEVLNQGIELRIAAVKEGSEDELKLRKQLIENERKLEIKKNQTLIPEERQSEVNINAKYDKMLEDLQSNHQLALMRIQEEGIQLRLKSVKVGSEDELKLQSQLLEQQRAIALKENALLPENQRMSEADINAGFDKQATTIGVNYVMTGFDQAQELAMAKFNTVEHTEREITRFTLEQERERWRAQVSLAEAGLLDWSQAQIDTAKATMARIDKDISKISGFKGFIGQVGEKGLTGGILEALGFDDEAIDAFTQATNVVLDSLNEIMQAEIEAAEAAVTAAEMRVTAAQSAYDAEVEARNNGYANNVESAKKTLELERKNQQEKERLLAEAQQRQEQLNSITQASSLITAAAQLWSTMSAIPIVGPALAATAIATMFGSFIFAKVKAKQVTSQKYSEGGLEFLEGGSHASGNDIDLHTKNSRGRNMKAEGGEALAIINKRNTRRYRKILPDVIESFNNGTFEDKYIKAFASSVPLNLIASSQPGIDLSKIEGHLVDIRKQNEKKMYVLPNGTTVTYYKNVKRISRNS